MFSGCHTHSGANCEVVTPPPTCDPNATYSPPDLVSATIDASFSYIVLLLSGPTNFGGVRDCDGNVMPFSCLFLAFFLLFFLLFVSFNFFS